jgi:hypothetical protein
LGRPGVPHGASWVGAVSIRLMALTFELDISSAEKLVLLAMADHARDDGTGCYPSIGTLARKTSQTTRGVRKIMRRLEEAGLISPSRVSHGYRSTEYKITLENPEPRSLFSSTKPGTPFPRTRNRVPENPEPRSLEPGTGFPLIIRNRKEPSRNLRRSNPAACGNLGGETTATRTGALLAIARSSPVEDAAALEERRRVLTDQARFIQAKYKTSCSGKAKT